MKEDTQQATQVNKEPVEPLWPTLTANISGGRRKHGVTLDMPPNRTDRKYQTQ